MSERSSQTPNIPDWPTTLQTLETASTTQDLSLLQSTLRTWYCTPRPSDTKFLHDLRLRTAASFDRSMPIEEITTAWDTAWDREAAELEERYSELQLQQSAWRKKGARKRERMDAREEAYKTRLYEATTRACSGIGCENLVVGEDVLGRREVLSCALCRAISSTLTRREGDYFEWMVLYCSTECRDGHESIHHKEDHACGAAERCTNQPRPPVTASSLPGSQYCKYCWEDYRKPTIFCNIRCQAAAQSEHGQRVTATHDRVQAQSFKELEFKGSDGDKPPSSKAVRDFTRWLRGWMSDEELDAYKPKLDGLSKGVPWMEADQS